MIVARPANTASMLKLAAALIAIAVLATGCRINRAPLFQYDEEGNKLQFQRIARNHMWNRNLDDSLRIVPWAYNKNTGKKHWLLSSAQKDVIALMGQPDYIRRPFYSRTNEKVNEWVYWKEKSLVQFINRDVVYVGPMTDREEILIRQGYPTYYIHTPLRSGLRETFIYSNDLEQRRDTYYLLNGDLIDRIYLGN